MTDARLKQALAKMLPEKTIYIEETGLQWDTCESNRKVRDTELLHVCAMAEKTLGNSQCPTQSQWCQYIIALQEICGETPSLFATWQQRATALSRVKGIEL